MITEKEKMILKQLDNIYFMHSDDTIKFLEDFKSCLNYMINECNLEINHKLNKGKNNEN